ncbi:MAG: PadR family transcriptional regulator [Actinobacteria bacterium]|nr:MAG: PadR family transcriptional regulator [Actinomycetota bacterium]
MPAAKSLEPASYVVLGMLRLGARSGYDIKRAVDVSTRFFWTISPAQIYPNLRRLERAGLVRGRSEPRGRRPRRLYELTSEGEAELAAWLRRDEPLTWELRDAGTLKLFFADALEPAEAAEVLAGIRRRGDGRHLSPARTRADGSRLTPAEGDDSGRRGGAGAPRVSCDEWPRRTR